MKNLWTVVLVAACAVTANAALAFDAATGERGAAHGTMQVVLWLQEARCVENLHLHAAFRAQSDDPVPRGLRFRTRDGEVLANEPVQQGALPRVRSARDRDDSRSGHLF